MKSVTVTQLLSVGFSFYTSAVVRAIQPEPSILGQGCALLKQHIIYCYGGATYVANANNRHAATHDAVYALDLQQASTNVDSWRLISPRGGSIGPNAAFAFAALADGVQMIVHGGWGLNDGRVSVVNQTTVFNAETESWDIIPMAKKTTAMSQMPAILDMNQTVWIWGGQTSDKGDGNGDVPEPENIRSFSNRQLVSSRASFPTNIYARLGHSAAVLAGGEAILYFGGVEAETEERELDEGSGFRNASMSEILVFYPKNQSWTIRHVGSDIIPSARCFHTTTPVPGTSDIILYGGRAYGTDRPVSDFLYKYNTDLNVWTRIHLKTAGAGPRWGHTAILYQINRLFILFGADDNSASTNDFYTLRTDLLQWEGGGRHPGAGGKPGDDDHGGGFGGGAVVGIIIAILAVLTGLALLYFYAKRRKQRTKHVSRDSHVYANDEPQGRDSLILGIPPKDRIPEHKEHYPGSHNTSAEAIQHAAASLLHRILQHKPDVPPVTQSSSLILLHKPNQAIHKPNQFD